MVATLGAALFAAAVVLYVVSPLVTGKQARVTRTALEFTDAEAWKLVTLRALRDVEYDYHTGKLDDQDYEELKTELTAEAAQALKRAQLDDAPADVRASRVAAVEAEILAMRAALRDVVSCSECNHSNPPGSHFCAACGVGLTSTQLQSQ